MLFRRLIQASIEKHLYKGKIIIIFGARRVGKTTLVRQILENYPQNSLYLNCDEPDVKLKLTNKTSTELLENFSHNKLVVLDEAQRVPDIGLTLKLIVDNAPAKLQVIATGSSSFDLSNKINEPLTGRAFEFLLLPLALSEINQDPIETNRLLKTRMTYGSYPEIVLNLEDNEETLRRIQKNYLYKDALEFQGLRNPELVEKLLVALALQIGQEVSLSELARTLEVDKKTISTYIRLLELAFVIFRLSPLSRNLRQEINRPRKIYFWDTGIRNAIINNFNPLSLRSDTGQIFENFVVAERQKRNSILGKTPNKYFWRTWSQSEVDYIEEEGGEFSAFEIKWQKKVREPKVFRQTYPNSTWTLVTKDNLLDFLSVNEIKGLRQ